MTEEEAKPQGEIKPEEVKVEKKPKREINKWKIISMVLIVILAVSFLVFGTGITGMTVATSDNIVGSEEAANKAIEFINENLVREGELSLVSTNEISGMYNVTFSYQGMEGSFYLTEDGRYLIILGLGIFDLTEELPKPPETQEQPQQPTQPSPIQVSVDDDPSKGSLDAPVIIVEFSDFQCPFCAKFWRETLPQIQSEYIDTGKVKFVYRDFPLSSHQNAQKAAEAAECADDQGKFWEMHDKLFENQQALDTISLKQYAKDLGLDSTQFDSCLDSGKYTSEVQKDFQDGQSYGVSGTPAFFINGIIVSGAQPFSVFQQTIDAELAK